MLATGAAELSEKLVAYCREASRIADEGQASLAASTKDDQSLVTNIDLQLSELAFTYFSPIVGETNIISEENLQNMDRVMDSVEPDDSPREEEELLVVVDPVDGTRNYAHRMPLYGISIGVLRNRRPWLGAVAFPAFNELLFTDGDKPYLTACDDAGKPGVRELTPPEPKLERTDILLMGDATRLEILDFDVCDCMSIDCATVELCWPLLGRGAAAIVGAHLWDFCGTWPIAEKLGFELRGLTSGRRLESFVPAEYHRDDYTIRDRFVLSRPAHYQRIADSATGKGSV